MEIRRVDLHNPEEADLWYAAVRAAASADRVAPVVEERDALFTSLRSNDANPNYDRRAYGAWLGGACVGTALIDVPRRDNRHLAELEIGVPPHARHRGVGRALFERLRDVAWQEERTTLAAEVNAAGVGAHTLTASPGGRFALACGFVSKHTELRLMLDVPVPEARIKELEANIGHRAGQYSLRGWIGIPPLDVLEPFARMHTLMDADVPSGEKSREPVVYDAARVLRIQQRLIEQGYGLVTTLISDGHGEPIGYTSLLVMGGMKREVLQDNTFVRRPNRGRGLGTLMKLANLRLLAENFPQAAHVHTWTAEGNDAMRAVNERMGFRAVETLHELELTLVTSDRG